MTIMIAMDMILLKNYKIIKDKKIKNITVFAYDCFVLVN